jgi:4-amino-4-deoxy-L-arabinose transferase-like glycosyltransferase
MSPGQRGWLCRLDPSMATEGPGAQAVDVPADGGIATLGGSPAWGLGNRFREFLGVSTYGQAVGEDGLMPTDGPSSAAAATGLERLRPLLVLLLAALVLFTVRIGDLSLPSLEDAFYAREAVEMARAGRVYTVTWNGIPTHQHPPLHLWLVSRTFSALGEHDLAARLPTVLLALGVLALTWRIGVLTVGHAAAAGGTACLLATPIFVDNARRLMMEVPLTFWVAATVWVYLEARGRPRWQVLLAVPLGAAILTKSVLGLMPLLVLAGALASEELRTPLRRPWVWIGVGLGLALGASWPLHQWWTQGPDAVASHLFAHVVRRSTRSFGLGVLRDYPLILLKFYQPIILPGLVGLWLVLRRPGPLRARGAILAAWIVFPLLLYSLSSFRTPRFAFPILPALALGAGYMLVAVVPRLAAVFASILVPAAAAALALLFWWSPSLLTRDVNAAFKRNAATIQTLAPQGESVPYLGNHYWASASPLLYYGERHLAASGRSGSEAVEAARRHGGRLLLVTRQRLSEVTALGVPHRVLLEGRDWVLLRVPRDNEPAA